MWNTDHHEILLTEQDLLGSLDAMADALDEPYAGGLPSWFVFREMGRHVKVAMTGTGGDELFGNYGKWLAHEWGGKRLTRIRTFLRNGGSMRHLLASPHGALHYPYFTDAAKQSLLTPAFASGLSPSTALLEHLWRASPDADPRSRVAFMDFQLQLPEEFLFMTDRFSMAHSVEARTPLLDRELVETVFRIPPEARTTSGSLKRLFIAAVADLLPPAVLSSRKRGFVLPAGRWLRGRLRPLVEDLCNPSSLRTQGIFQESVFEQIVRPHLSGERNLDWQLWTILSFQLWYDHFISPSRVSVR